MRTQADRDQVFTYVTLKAYESEIAALLKTMQPRVESLITDDELGELTEDGTLYATLTRINSGGQVTKDKAEEIIVAAKELAKGEYDPFENFPVAVTKATCEALWVPTSANPFIKRHCGKLQAIFQRVMASGKQSLRVSVADGIKAKVRAAIEAELAGATTEPTTQQERLVEREPARSLQSAGLLL